MVCRSLSVAASSSSSASASWSVIIICAWESICAMRVSALAGSGGFLPAAWAAPAMESTPSTIHVRIVVLLAPLSIDVSEQPWPLEGTYVILERGLPLVGRVGGHLREEL